MTGHSERTAGVQIEFGRVHRRTFSRSDYRTNWRSLGSDVPVGNFNLANSTASVLIFNQDFTGENHSLGALTGGHQAAFDEKFIEPNSQRKPVNSWL